jgi:nitrogen fixation protein FixH
MLLAFFGVVIGVNVTMMKLAIATLPGTEVDSAYSASIGYEKEIRAAHDQAARDWRVDAHIVRDRDGFATLQVEARDKDGQPLSGLSFRGMLERPTDKRADLAVALSEVGNGVYRGNAGDRARTMGSGDRGRYGGGRADVPVQEPRDVGLESDGNRFDSAARGGPTLPWRGRVDTQSSEARCVSGWGDASTRAPLEA